MMPTISPCEISNETVSRARNASPEPRRQPWLNRSERRSAGCLCAPTRYCLVSPVARMAISFMRMGRSNAIREDRVDLAEGHDATDEQHDKLAGQDSQAEQIGRRRVGQHG